MNIKSALKTIEDLIDFIIEISQKDKFKISKLKVMLEDDKLTHNNEIIELSLLLKNLSHKINAIESLTRQLDGSFKSISNYVINKMNEIDINKITNHPEITVSIKKCPHRLVINDESLISNDYFYEKLTIDKKLILEHLKDGMNISGCDIKQDNRLEIKYKPIKAKDCI